VSVIKFIKENSRNRYKMPYYLLRGEVFKVLKKLYPDMFFSWKIFNGYKIFISSHSASASSFLYSDYFDKKQVDLLRQHASSNTIFFGYWS
jgi:hypothetical protein